MAGYRASQPACGFVMMPPAAHFACQSYKLSGSLLAYLLVML